MRIGDERLPKQLLYGELGDGRRPAHKTKLKFKYCLENALIWTGIATGNWEKDTQDHDGWRKCIVGCARFERGNMRELIGGLGESERVLPFMFVVCGGKYLSRTGLVSHQKSNRNRLMINSDLAMDISNRTCVKCRTVCFSVRRLKRNFKNVHTVAPVLSTNHYFCHQCEIKCAKSWLGLSHIRAFQGNNNEPF